MVTSLNNRMVGRDEGYQQRQYIAARHTLTGTDLPITRVGGLPAGAIILGISTKVNTAVSGGTPVLGVGSVSPGTTPTSSNVGTNANINNAVAVGAGSAIVQPLTALVMPLATDLDVYIGTTGGATAGDLYVIVEFAKPIS